MLTGVGSGGGGGGGAAVPLNAGSNLKNLLQRGLGTRLSASLTHGHP